MTRFRGRACLWALPLLVSACSQPAPELDEDSPFFFQDIAEEAGVVFQHDRAPGGKLFMPEIVGAGVAVLDFDGDGDMDLFFVQGGPVWGQEDSGEAGRHALYRNELIPRGTLHFTDVSATAGFLPGDVGMGAAVGDFDNDGKPDLLVTSFGSNRLYRNLGEGRFAPVALPAASGPRWSTSAAFVDYDKDGWQDLYIANYVDFSPETSKDCKSAQGAPDYCGPQVYHGLSDQLLRNTRGQFEDVTLQAQINHAPGPGLGVTALDFNSDGWPDIYVANDGKPNHLWINQQDGTFREEALELGAAIAESGMPRAGMGIAVADADGNGFPDVLVTNLTNEGATLFGNQGAIGFLDVSAKFNLGPATVHRTGFGVGWIDACNRGVLDLFIANGAVRFEHGAPEGPDAYRQKNLFLTREGDRLVDATATSGPGMALEDVSRAAAFVDLDNNGAVDIVVTNNGGPARLLHNQSKNRGHWLMMALVGGEKNPLGAGAMVEVERPGLPVLRRPSEWAYSYLAANDPRVHFGLGDSGGPVTVRVTWPDGVQETWDGQAVDRIVELRRGTGVSGR